MKKYLPIWFLCTAVVVSTLMNSCDYLNEKKEPENSENKVATPTASQPNGYSFPIGGGTVTLSCGTEDAVIRYTTNNTTPSQTSTGYTAPITVNADTTIKAIAFKDGMEDSDILTVSYTVAQQGENKVATPTASQPNGYKFPVGGGTVTLSCGTEDAVIRYTTNDATPSQTSTGYTGPITVNADTTIKAIAFKDGMTDSDMLTVSYTVAKQDTSIETAMELVRDMKLGVNIGNTFDSIGGPTAWGNPTPSVNYIRALKAHGFTTIRFPVTWAENIGPAPDYIVDSGWMRNVKTIVDRILPEDMYCIINVHHDGADIEDKSWIDTAGENATKEAEVKAKYAALWRQIAETFNYAGDKLVFESLNEPQFDKYWNRYNNTGNKTLAFRLLTDLNQIFLDTVRGTGGNNASRFLLISSYWTDIDVNIQNWGNFFFMPTDTAANGTDKLILSFHYYTPWNFCGGNSTTWTNTSELNTQFNKIRDNILSKGIPVIIGEYAVDINVNGGSTPKNSQHRLNWMLGVTQKCVDLGICPVLWDTGMRDNNKGMADVQRGGALGITDNLRDMIAGVVWPATP